MPDLPPIFGARPRKRAGGSSIARDRSAAYRHQRARMMADEPLCRYCRGRGHITAAAVLDHIVALSIGGTNDPSNLAPACVPCNDAKGLVERRCQHYGRDAVLDPELAGWIRLARLIDA